jgi:hypothetical protein
MYTKPTESLLRISFAIYHSNHLPLAARASAKVHSWGGGTSKEKQAELLQNLCAQIWCRICFSKALVLAHFLL